MLRIGAVNYLNSKPLVEGLSDLLSDGTLTFDLPSRLASSLKAGDLDVALIPSVEFFQNPGYTIISDACVGCLGPVFSVRVFFRTDPAQVKKIALDEGSRTSAALTQILLYEKYKIRPTVESFQLDASLDTTEADAILLIGDRAMHTPPEKFVQIWDLGEEWFKLTSLPFVFAAWVARPGVDFSELEKQLETARNNGVRQLSDIARREADKLQLSFEVTEYYLKTSLRFSLKNGFRTGLETFYQKCVEQDFAPPQQELRFYDCSTL